MGTEQSNQSKFTAEVNEHNSKHEFDTCSCGQKIYGFCNPVYGEIYRLQNIKYKVLKKQHCEICHANSDPNILVGGLFHEGIKKLSEMSREHCCKCKKVMESYEKHCNECCITFHISQKHCCKCNCIYNEKRMKHCCKCKNMMNHKAIHCNECCDTVFSETWNLCCESCDIIFYETQEHCRKCNATFISFDEPRIHCDKCDCSFYRYSQAHCCQCDRIYNKNENHCCKCKVEWTISHCCDKS